MSRDSFPELDSLESWLDDGFETDEEPLDYERGEFPVLPLRDTVIYPQTVTPLFVGREASVRAVNEATEGDQRLIVVAQHDPEIEKPGPDDLYSVGTEVIIGRKLRMPDGSLNIWVQGQRRVELIEFRQTEPYLRAVASPVEESYDMGLSTEALMRAVLALFEKVVHLSHSIPEDAYIAAMNADDPGTRADLIASVTGFDVIQKQEVLEIADASRRLQRVSMMLAAELDVLELENRINSRVQEEVDRSQREYYLREQMRAIQTELSEADPSLEEVSELQERLEEKKLPDDVREKATKELARLSSMSSAQPESTIVRSYLDLILDLPWAELSQDRLNIKEAAKILESSHYGLPRAKERVLEHIAVYHLAPDKMRNPILCFVGPPGTGKTSLGKSIAEALGREFVRISLGGIKDEAEIRGHRRTYIGALPGRILQGMRRAGTKNPVFMLDEIDKVGQDFHGDPASALLEVLDPEQNNSFSDHYLEMPFDLSKVMFITTANLLDPIPSALLDRMEVIEFSGYMEEEKIEIARRFLIPNQIEQNGLETLRFSDGSLQTLVREYTFEAGVRNLDREIATICRKVARIVAEDKPAPAAIGKQSLTKYLGPPKRLYQDLEKIDMVGVATGLAWTEAGGDTLYIEVTVMEGKGSLTLTGQLGEVMQESAQAALSYARSHSRELGIGSTDFDKIDIHIHVPEGAVPKDGPSAGVTIATALISALSDRPVRHEVAMTGEITLRGRVLGIGGLREKALAARRAGLKTMLVPRQNERDMVDIPRPLRRGLDFVFVDSMDQILPLALQTPTNKRGRAQ